MKPLLFTFLCIFFFVQQVKGTCDFHPYSDDIRLGIINDRQIYTLFTRHNSNRVISHLIYAMDATPKEQAIRELNAALEIYQPRVQSEQSDVRQIIELIESQQIDWIGIEASQRELQSTPLTEQMSIHSEDKAFLDTFASDPQWDHNKTDQVLSLLYPTIVIAHAQKPEAFHEIRVIPLENNEQKREALAKTSQITRQKNVLIHLFHRRLITPHQFQTINTFFSNRLNNVITSNSSREMESLLASLQEEARIAVNTYIDQINEFVSLNEERSHTAAISISRQSGNGLVIMGSTHGNTIEEDLKITCHIIQI